jgi:hypothetical protein
MNNQVLDLSWNRKLEVIRCGYPIKEELMFQCAYYPRVRSMLTGSSVCMSCSFESPNKKCKRSHLLWIGRDEEKSRGQRGMVRAAKGASRGYESSSPNGELEFFLSSLSKEEAKLLLEIVRK